MRDRDEAFLDLIARVRARDDQAAAELVRRYEPQVRRVIRVRLSPRLRKQMDSVDISQSILGEFFLRAAHGQFELPTPENLIQLLSTMAYNKLTNRYHQATAQRRDVRKEEAVEDLQVAKDEPTPSRIVESRELLLAMRQRLSDEERQLADHRAEGRSWQEIAAANGGTPDACRLRLRRALDRVIEEMGLEDWSLA